MDMIATAWRTFFGWCALSVMVILFLAFPHGMLVTVCLMAGALVLAFVGWVWVMIVEDGKHCQPGAAVDRMCNRPPMVDESKIARFEAPRMRVVK